MKRLIILLVMCLALTLSGCQSKSPVNQSAKNANGTPAVNLPAQITQAPAQVTQDPDPVEPKHGEASAQVSSGDIIEIKEKMFIAQTNDVYFNAPDYLGKTIKYEGIFDVFEVPETGATYYSVIRYGPGCCGIDANAGFEVIWDKDYPNQNDWVEAVGVLEEYEENGFQFLRLQLSSLTVLPTRGAEYVEQ